MTSSENRLSKSKNMKRKKIMDFKKFHFFVPRNLQRNFPGYSFIRQHQHKQILCKLCFKTHVLLVMLSSYYYSLVHIARRQREDKCGLTDCKWSQCWKGAKVDDGFLFFIGENFPMINDFVNDFWRVFQLHFLFAHTHFFQSLDVCFLPTLQF